MALLPICQELQKIKENTRKGTGDNKERKGHGRTDQISLLNLFKWQSLVIATYHFATGLVANWLDD